MPKKDGSGHSRRQTGDCLRKKKNIVFFYRITRILEITLDRTGKNEILKPHGTYKKEKKINSTSLLFEMGL
jgi:hypothetical protein